MICPTCNQPAATVLGQVLALRDVSIAKSAQGYFKCQHCSTLLRVTSYGKRFWYFYIPAIFVLALFAVVYQRLLPTIGPSATALLWVVLVIAISVTFALGLWKSAIIQKVDTDISTESSITPST